MKGAPGASAAKASRMSFSRVSIGLVTSGRPETTAVGRRQAQDISQRIAQPIGVALHDFRLRVTVAQQRAEARIVFDQDEALLIDAAVDQGAGDRAGAGAELDHGTGRIAIDILRHGASQ